MLRAIAPPDETPLHELSAEWGPVAGEGQKAADEARRFEREVPRAWGDDGGAATQERAATLAREADDTARAASTLVERTKTTAFTFADTRRQMEDAADGAEVNTQWASTLMSSKGEVDVVRERSKAIAIQHNADLRTSTEETVRNDWRSADLAGPPTLVGEAVTPDRSAAGASPSVGDAETNLDTAQEELARAGRNDNPAMEQALRDAGLLTGPPASGHYRQWLENAERRGVSIETIKQIAAEHHIKPQDFEVLDRMEEVREDEDGDGIFKSYFLMPTDISGEDAAKAARMTYILNAGTDYGTEGETTDFAPTPYGSEELRRITERQQANSWSYNDDVGFVHGNGGRLMTTPNGMMMGLGGNFIQDQFSQQGGTAYGDTFMLNIDDPADPAQQLREVAQSGHAWYEGDDGPYRGSLDLDRLLHHEERHSQQWAREGYAGFLTSYGWEQITGGNETEEDAGLSDGGYH
ncbi:hypothetical protein ACPZ19_50980 [Amycolatopsis lurida]